jgi:adenosylmethionine-8-amino-7-oxononanoate aminotransferase
LTPAIESETKSTVTADLPKTFDPATHAFWHGFAPMNFVLKEAGPQDMWVRGEGSWLIDARGNRYLDGRSGIGNMALGYSRGDIARAMYRQAQELPFVCTMRWERAVPVAVDYARALVDAAPLSLTRARLTHTGSSAVESALLMARTYQRNLGRKHKKILVALDGSYHGSTMMAMAASGQRLLHRFFGPMPEGFAHIPPPDMSTCDTRRDSPGAVESHANMSALLERLEPDDVAAIIVEPVKGLSGVPLPTHYLQELRKFCTQHDILLIFDEVFSGFGRMGTMFAAEISGVTPDIMCLAKAITAGYAALGAVLATDQVYDAFNISATSSFAHASSTDAHPVACAAALATLRAFEKEDIVARGRTMGEHLRVAVADMLTRSPHFRAVRARGAYVGIDLIGSDGRPASMTIKRHLEAACRRRGLLIDYTPDTIMLIPPLTLAPEEADLIAETLAEVVVAFREQDIDESSLRPSTLRGHR